MASWRDLEVAEPELAAFGAGRLSIPPAYLATIRVDGRPRVHPVTPIVGGGRLFVFMEPTSPKGTDLRQRGQFALHNGVPDINGTGGEFFLSGTARMVDDEDVRGLAASAASYRPADRYVLFELDIREAGCNGHGYTPLPTRRGWTTSSV